MPGYVAGIRRKRLDLSWAPLLATTEYQAQDSNEAIPLGMMAIVDLLTQPQIDAAVADAKSWVLDRVQVVGGDVAAATAQLTNNLAVPPEINKLGDLGIPSGDSQVIIPLYRV